MSTPTMTVALHLMAGNTLDYKAIAMALFKDDPAKFLEYSRIEKSGPLWMHSVVQSLKNNHLVEAIKTVRTHTGLGLKEAKDIVDIVRDYEHKPSTLYFTDQQHDLVKQLQALQ